ncbi:hypothetical protein EB796_018185 [Bugula neritina]|uniref:Uncharacterized protein n=1 Tax=Bugula neritina TaxID=10212 RepID=A0A7J7JBQ1_BUGNE|nr:hypothetical protein EB796_018185 [Bugula neritina]
MANNQYYNPYDNGMSHQSTNWMSSPAQANPANPGTQNWTQPAPQMPSAPFYSSPNQSTKPAARIGWQQRSGWHKGGSLHADPSPSMFSQSDSQSRASYFTPSSSQQDFTSQSHQDFNQDVYTSGHGSGPLLPQAQVFQMANAQITSRMVSGRGRGWGARGGVGQKSQLKNLPALSPLQMLNQKNLIGLVQNIRVVDGEERIYVASFSYAKHDFFGTGRSKNDAYNDASKYLLQYLGDSLAYVPEEHPAASNVIPDCTSFFQAKKYQRSGVHIQR